MKKILLCCTLYVVHGVVCKSQTVTDIDSNVYNTVSIGTQIWMKENLKTTKYRNGDLIGTTNPATLDISSESAPKYQWAYDGIESYAINNGRLYTWFVVTDERNVCPIGWHVPTDTDWTTLTDYLTNNGFGYQGSGDDIAKSMASSLGWNADATAGNVGNDQTSNNRSGFSAIPTGSRLLYECMFNFLGMVSYWWSSTEYDSSLAWNRIIGFDNNYVFKRKYLKKWGLSIRCIKDNVIYIVSDYNNNEKFYPNPANDWLHIKDCQSSKVLIMINDLQGKRLVYKHINSSQIDISNLSKGIYIVKIVDSGNIFIDKLIKE